jgi:hypothetical protein
VLSIWFLIFFLQYYLELTYKPLRAEKDTKVFEATCKELGTFCYSLILTAHAPVPEPATCFKAFLGQTVTQKIEVAATKDAHFEVSVLFSK